MQGTTASDKYLRQSIDAALANRRIDKIADLTLNVRWHFLWRPPTEYDAKCRVRGDDRSRFAKYVLPLLTELDEIGPRLNSIRDDEAMPLKYSHFMEVR